MTAPIALFVYNRPEHTRRTLEALRRNALAEASDLFVYADAPKNEEAAANVVAVRALVSSTSGFKSVTVIERETNLGVDASVIDGVTTLSARFGEVIVLEDDLVTSPWFLTYMNEGLDRYRDEQRVMQVAGFMFPLPTAETTSASFLPYSNSWGWATWQRAWERFDIEAKGFSIIEADSRLRHAYNLNGAYDYFALLRQYAIGKTTAWDICWYTTIFLQKGLTLFPHQTLVDNIGFDGSGIHCSIDDKIISSLALSKVDAYPSVQVDTTLWKQLELHLKSVQPPAALRRRILSGLRDMISLSAPLL